MIVYQYLNLGKGGSIEGFCIWSKLLIDELKSYR